MRFLAFTLTAPLASFGSIAVGELRPSWDRPAKSAVLGLIAGALGITRDDADAHRVLANDFFYAVRVEDFSVRTPRRMMADYHTAQTAPTQRGRRFATRRDELSAAKLETILTRREYRTDCCFTALVWSGAASRFNLEQIAAALRAPVFTPYLGRKSCPLMLPMTPRIVEAEEPLEAFRVYDGGESEGAIRFRKERHATAMPRSIALDAAASASSNQGRLEKRRDAIVHRTRWQFGLREEVIVPLMSGADD
jgi:CRISPR system Cascade subunit CasD